MRMLTSQFERTIADSKKLPERPDNRTFVRIYLLYKQAAAPTAAISVRFTLDRVCQR